MESEDGGGFAQKVSGPFCRIGHSQPAKCELVETGKDVRNEIKER